MRERERERETGEHGAKLEKREARRSRSEDKALLLHHDDDATASAAATHSNHRNIIIVFMTHDGECGVGSFAFLSISISSRFTGCSSLCSFSVHYVSLDLSDASLAHTHTHQRFGMSFECYNSKEWRANQLRERLHLHYCCWHVSSLFSPSVRSRKINFEKSCRAAECVVSVLFL